MMNDYLWWKHGVIYQIYTRSFKDSNNDGVGDIQGIIEKLDYLDDLGVDAIWLSPINKSPMRDFGYDIEDYYSIDPIFGNLQDFDKLVASSHERNIKVIMDLVVNHTSDQHHWFKESRSSLDNPKRNWYIWRKGRRNKPPNNWKAACGGSTWEFDETTGEYYLHSFLKEQPDLNWRNKQLKKKIFKMMTFWLDRGVDGFRIDMVNWLIKDRKFRNNTFTWKIFFQQKRRRYDRNRPKVHKLLKKMRALIDRYEDRMLVGEVFTLIPGDPGLSAKFLGNGNDELHLAFDFSLMYRLWNAKYFYNAVKKWYEKIPSNGWPCFVLSNHDQPRGRSRFMGAADSDGRARVAAVFLLTLRGTPFLYYGEELGMKNAKLNKAELVDPLGKKFWPIYKGRDLSRAPMLWGFDKYAAFSKTEPWLPVDRNYENLCVEKQLGDPDAILNLYKTIIALRKAHIELSRGDFIPIIKGQDNIIAYYRKYRDHTSFIALNFSNSEKKIQIKDSRQWRVLFSTHRMADGNIANLRLAIRPNEAIILKDYSPP